MAKELTDMGLGEIVREIVDNSISIHCICTGNRGYSPENASCRHSLEQQQEQLYNELSRREESYKRSDHTHNVFGGVIPK